MKTYFDCIPCFIRQVLDAVRTTSKDKQVQLQILRQALRLASEADLTQSPPATAQQIHRYIRQLTGNPDPYAELKVKFNKIALRMYPDLKTRIEQSADPLETAVRLAIAGNIIDFGVNGSLQKSDIEQTISECLAADFPDTPLKSFQRAIDRADDILYITDNAGEIVFDRLLIEQLPVDKITVVVKGQPVINDATMTDAMFAGLPSIVEVIDNGSDAPGTILESCSQSFMKRFDEADLIIAKGQGNYETLNNVRKNIFFILKVKCSVLAQNIGCEVGRMIFQKTKAFKGEKENAAI